MTTAMERAIESLSNPDVSIADALRRLLVVARRIGADELAGWIKLELEGYGRDGSVPKYRDGSGLPIAVRFDGYMGSSETRQMFARELPEDLASVMDGFNLHMPLGELDALVAGDNDAQTRLPNAWLHLYRQAATEGRVPHMPGWEPNHAAVVVPQTYLMGILDRIKTVALDLALGIEDVSPTAGDAGGPTVASEPSLGETVRSHMTMIFATNSNVSVASGAGASAVQVAVGDVEGLLTAARAFLADESVQDLSAALVADGGEPGANTSTFMERVRTGGVVLTGSVATSAAYDGLMSLIGHVFPGSGF